MMTMWGCFALTFVLAVGIFPAHGYEVCSTSGIYNRYCDDGYYCCSTTTCCAVTNPLGIAAIIGIVIGGIVGLCALIACICFCVQQQKGRPGRVVAPNTGTTIAYVSQPGQLQPYGQAPAYGQAPQPANGQPPPVFGSQQPPGYIPQTSAPEYPPPN